MKTIEQLLTEFAKVKLQIKQLKKESSEIGHCARPMGLTGLPENIDCQSCIDIAISLKNQHNKDYPHHEDYLNFHDFIDCAMPFEVCDTCKKHIETKKKRKALNKPLGILQAQITKRAISILKNN